MNLLKIYAVIFVVLLVCTLESEGGLIIALLIKLIALKGALFLGTPIALGAFLMGQGVGFFAGNLAGGFAVLKTAQKFHEREKAKWKSPKGWGWNKESPLYSKGYKKGYGLGSLVSDLLDKHKGKGWGWQPDHDDHYGGYPDYDYGHHAHHDHHSSGYKPGPPLTHFHYYPSLSHSYGGYSGTPAYHSPPSHGYQRKTPSMMERIIGRIPGASAIFGSNTDNDHSYDYVAGHPPQHNYNAHDPYGYQDYSSSHSHDQGSFASPQGTTYNDAYSSDGSAPYSFKGQDPMNTYQPGIFSSPPSNPNPSPPKYKASPGGGYSFAEGYKAAKQADNYHTSDADAEPHYDYAAHDSPSSSKPGYDESKYFSLGDDEVDDTSYSGAASTYDGPAKQYTGVMTDNYDKFQSTKPKAFEKPLGNPMGPEDYALSQEHSDYSPYDLSGQGSKAHRITGVFSNSKPYNKKSPGSASQESIATNQIVPAPNHLLEKYLEEKLEEQAKKAKDDDERRETRELIKLLKQVYVQQLEASMKSESDKENARSYVPVPNSTKPTTTTTRAPSRQTTVVPVTPRPNIPVATTTTAPPAFRSTTQKPAFVHVSTVSWLKNSDPQLLSMTGISPFFPEATSSRHKRAGQPESKALNAAAATGEQKGDTATIAPASEQQLGLTPEQIQQLQLLYGFIEEIKQFFTLVSILDQDTCLQKMVCDVHATMASGQAQPQLSEYESNLISTFRIMDTLIPLDANAPEDSSTKYRLAAKLGEAGKSTDTCKTYYALCGYSKDQIMSLGSQVEATQEQNVPVQPGPVTAESMSMSMSASSSSSSVVTAMPRV